VYDHQQPQQIVERVLALRENPALLAQMRADALQYARGRTWQSTMDQLISYYELAIRVHRQRGMGRQSRQSG
jgi:glycosyltransferase involved in cell wall biosynthesis